MSVSSFNKNDEIRESRSQIDQVCFLCQDIYRIKKHNIDCGHGMVCLCCYNRINQGSIRCTICVQANNFIFPNTPPKVQDVPILDSNCKTHHNEDIPILDSKYDIADEDNWFVSGKKPNKSALRVPSNLFVGNEIPSEWIKISKPKNPTVGKWEKYFFLLLHYLYNAKNTDGSKIDGSKIPRNVVYDEYFLEGTQFEYFERYEVGEWFHALREPYLFAQANNATEFKVLKKNRLNKKQVVWLDNLVMNGIVWWDIPTNQSSNNCVSEDNDNNNNNNNNNSNADETDHLTSTEVDDDYNGNDSDIGSLFDELISNDLSNNSLAKGIMEKFHNNDDNNNNNNSTSALITPKSKRVKYENFQFVVSIQLEKVDVTGNNRQVYCIEVGKVMSRSKVGELKDKIRRQKSDYKEMKLFYNQQELSDDNKMLCEHKIDAKSGVIVCEKVN